MIYRIHSSLESFKTQEFRTGLNILVADKTKESTEKSTRNRAGKSSLVEIVHFLLGSNADKDSLFQVDALKKHRFEMTFDLGGQEVTVERSGENRSKVFVHATDTSAWPTQPAAKDGAMSNEAWKEVLGVIMFGLSSSNISNPGQPSFRLLFPYFARRIGEFGFNSFDKYAAKQQPWQQQLSLSYLLGLDWTLARDWQAVRLRETDLKVLAKSAGAIEVLSHVVGTVAELRTALVVAEADVTRLRRDLALFKVLYAYAEIEQEASILTREINGLADENTLDRRLVLDLSSSLAQEAPPEVIDLDRLYREAGVVINEQALRRFDEVKAFHDSVIANRSDYLKNELIAAEHRIAKREQEKTAKDTRRAELMEVLQTHGALEHFNGLRSELSKQEAEYESLKQRMQAAERLEGERTELDIERKGLVQRLRIDFKEREDFVNDAIMEFEESSRELYERKGAGHLSIEATNNGPQFRITVPGARSVGIKNMHIFCFDMMLMRLCAKRGVGPGFLIHDSHLFDGVDGRQVAHALELGAKTAEAIGFQYIVTMNSDDLYKEIIKYDLSTHVLSSRISDAEEHGGLFGMRFD